ncbi:MAG: hypothetical protein HLUCCO02_08960 [Idiomarinaceae bacterium HL-53]|nr:MAG: hypothetical protein HLUCCO02_08960 [Idiomarinaceae bacterium HL-53]CUS47661.1 hypothetical protein Ga0003345_0594 [Idiomarinaceae bacterium HL-53]
MEKFEYIGWTPCLNGHLDFGLTRVGIKGTFNGGNTLPDLKTIEENFSSCELVDHHARLIVLQSKVDWRDSLEYEKIDGFFRVFVTATVNNSDDMDERFLSGSILIYPLENEPSDIEAVRSMPIHEFSHQIQKEKSKNSFVRLHELVSAPSKIDGLEKKNLTCSLKFKMEPNGLTFLKLLESCSPIDARTKFVFARQAFYYLKYSVHNHRHHEDTQDSLTTIVNLENAAKKEIALKLVCQLKRELTNLGRIQKVDKKEHPTNNTSGILAYSKSLLIALRNSDYLTEKEFETQVFLLDNIKESFNSQSSEIRKRQELINQAKSKSKIWIGLILAFIFGVPRLLMTFPDEHKFEIGKSFGYSLPILIIVTCAAIYRANIEYYKVVDDPAKSEALYDGRKYINRAVSSVVVAVAAAILYSRLY